MGIQEPELVDLAHKLEDLQQKKSAHPLSKVCNDLTFTMNVWGSSPPPPHTHTKTYFVAFFVF
jgi:hypothetical protein